MIIDRTIFQIFKQGSRTYFYSSLFFPTKIRRKVFILYAFVRKADNYVDQIHQDKDGFYKFINSFEKGWNGEETGDIVVDSFVVLAKKHDFKKSWIDAFLSSMEMDLTNRVYYTFDDTLDYIYGSAEVIGLFMAKILALSDKSFEHAKFLGRAMQYINFIRDINEDNKLNRLYFPKHELDLFGLDNLGAKYVLKNKQSFQAFIDKQLERYCGWQELAEMGYNFIPRRYLIPIKTASEMYKWTGRKIHQNPFMIFELKVKPMVSQIVLNTLVNIVDIMVKKDQQVQCDFKHRNTY
jgi:phytoene synthase